MIRSLKVRHLATIEDLEVAFEPGFCILTGETGAGKSIIIDAIRLILGEKASADLLRSGAKEALVEAVFDAPESAVELGDIPRDEDGGIFVQRYIPEQGAGRAYINGVLVPARRLKELGGSLIDIYGQNDHVFLLQTESHRRFLDDFLDDQRLLNPTEALAREVRGLIQEKAGLLAREAEREQRLDFVSFQIREIENAGLKPGEDEELLREREIMKNAGRIAALVDRGLELAYLQDESLLPNLSRLKTVLEELAAFDRSFADFLPGLEEATSLVQEAAHSLSGFKDAAVGEPGDPEAVEERLSLIEKLKRKHGSTVEAILSRLEELRREKQALERSSERLQELEGILEKKFGEYVQAAGRLAEERRRAARRLERLIEKEIVLLGMKKASFKVKVESIAPCLEKPETVRGHGTEDVEFLISANPGEELKPLRKTASGGELSRIMLALKSAGKAGEPPKTLIFDEIDSGIGGKTADAVAEKIRSLSSRHQVLCITHLPQIASAASTHYHVEKSVVKDRTFTSVKKLTQAERVQEIARLISGSRVGEAALETARQMLERR